ncbi:MULTISPECIES: endonuclease/exonuclease/phosphatase family protein [unclassified Janthinobacterium]|uniref:endonuclease/exonuclease/phosphatase family protein n=1 Tax=unclassified Janthinobacterium TaxID=2610881 RepID=UPI00034601DA|nr:MULTISPECIES: endonuclease/exonuclease/phosphatase family protein [unclassified Janthinobacterium]MEC5159716.1 endonuclease/exonuclease/phosphatase family metal-dependent hydrolase [Janthinobacterium sp. CG_S6]
MQQEIRLATFNVCNLAPPGAKLYDNLEPLSVEQYQAKVDWTADQLDQLDADVIGLQEIFSPLVLRDVLARSRRYRDAQHACAAPDPAAERLTPGVALVSRLPLAAPVAFRADFPDGVAMPPGSRDADRFARAPLHAQIALPHGPTLDVVVVHLKSRRPDYRNGDCGDDPLQVAMANLRSLIRRGTEAVALRVLLAGLARDGGRRPRVVLGDFNDVADAVTTSIVLGGACCEPGREPAGRLYDSQRIQACQGGLRHLGYSNIHDGQAMTIDHILVSEEFNPASRNAIGEVLEVTYLNDHLRQALPQASDHGQVLARIRLYGARDGAN